MREEKRTIRKSGEEIKWGREEEERTLPKAKNSIPTEIAREKLRQTASRLHFK